MKVNGQFTFLGTGGSMGVPVIGCKCEICTSSSHFNKRRRSSALCTIGDQNLLIDCGPDFREQALKFNINEVDGVLFTHAHNDHMAGIDDLKAYCMRTGKPLPALLSHETEREIKHRFNYLFSEKQEYAGLMTRFALQVLAKERGDLVFQGIHIRYFAYRQMHMRVDGFRFGSLAYVTDIKDYPDTIFEDLKGVRTLILSALRFSPSPMHFAFDEAVAFSQKVGAEQTWLMHIAHETDHGAINAHLPKNVRAAYDGLQLDFDVEVVNGSI